MAAVVDSFKECYRKYVQVPVFSAGCILDSDERSGALRFVALSTMKDTVRMASRRVLQSYVSVGAAVLPFPMPADMEGVSNFAVDADGKMALARTVMKDGKPGDTFIEVWSDGVLATCIKATGKHGAVYDQESAFGGMSWAPDGVRLIYAAEAFAPEATAYFDAAKADAAVGQKNVLRDSWGEGMAAVVAPTIVILDTAAATFTFPMADHDDAVAWGQPTWCAPPAAPGEARAAPCQDFACVGYHGSRRLGLRFCLNRESSIFVVSPRAGTVRTVSTPGAAARSPACSPGGTWLVWLENAAGGPHARSSRLMKLALGVRGAPVSPADVATPAVVAVASVSSVAADTPGLGVPVTLSLSSASLELTALDLSPSPAAPPETPQRLPASEPCAVRGALDTPDGRARADSEAARPALRRVDSEAGARVVIDVCTDGATVGVYGARLPASCFVSENEIVITTFYRSSRIAVHVDVSTSVMAPLQHTGLDGARDGALDVLATRGCCVLAAVSLPGMPPALVLGRLAGTEAAWTAVTPQRPWPGTCAWPPAPSCPALLSCLCRDFFLLFSFTLQILCTA